MTIFGFSSDADPRCLKAMRIQSGLLSSTSLENKDSPYWPYFQSHSEINAVLGKARKDVVLECKKLGMVLNDAEQAFQEISLPNVYAENNKVEDLDSDQTDYEESQNFGQPCDSNPGCNGIKNDLSILSHQSLNLKDYSKTNISKNGPFLRISINKDKQITVRKSSLCWLFSEKHHMSTDRTLGVRNMGSASKPPKQKNRIISSEPETSEEGIYSERNDTLTEEFLESEEEQEISTSDIAVKCEAYYAVYFDQQCKIILRKPETYQTRDIDAAGADCLKYLESKIDVVLLDEFKQTKRRNYEWEGNTEDKSLYNVWHQIASDVEGLPKLVSEDPALENDLQTPSVSPLDASNLTDMFPVDKAKEVSDTSNDSNTALATTSRPDKVEQVTRNICFAQKTICSKVFYNVLPYTKENNTDSKKKRKKEYTTSVITSDKWVEYHEECERLKMEKEQKKQERKQVRESKKQMMARKRRKT
ncbi:hypothetical protein RN001_004229 [Aquatica leii]|uniref:Uncharacterized protein n=1 Tax=Aquatica leii TaxID=1421715 RepID=A0AAN7Q5L7_9COLE|nr:hypothetical protein RN001_004229 [Aquatica leii]